MKALKIDENGDWVMKDGEFVVIEGDEQLAQEARISIQTVRGEWFLNLDEGMDRSAILGKNFDENNARSNIIESLMNTSEPLMVEEITFTKVDRTLVIEPTLRKSDGTTMEVGGVRI